MAARMGGGVEGGGIGAIGAGGGGDVCSSATSSFGTLVVPSPQQVTVHNLLKRGSHASFVVRVWSQKWLRDHHGPCKA